MRVIAVLLLSLFSLESIMAAAEIGSQILHLPVNSDHRCAHDAGVHSQAVVNASIHDCADHLADLNESSEPEVSEFHAKSENEKGAHCENCNHCFGCHLSLIAHQLAHFAIERSSTSYSYHIRQTLLHLNFIDRPPIA